MDIFDLCGNIIMIIAVIFLIEVFILFNVFFVGQCMKMTDAEENENEQEVKQEVNNDK